MSMHGDLGGMEGHSSGQPPTGRGSPRPGSSGGSNRGTSRKRRGRPMESLTGRLLVATPALRDPNFERTVVLVVAHEEGGALGVVLNRATEVPVAEVLGPWGQLADEPSVVFEGGPVQPEAAICLARARIGVGDLS